MVHALSREMRQALRAALAWIMVQYREAAERLKDGEYDVLFPEGTFPPARPFVDGLAAHVKGHAILNTEARRAPG